MKSKKELPPEFRLKARELLHGFIDHCEISRSLIGEIRHFVHFEDRKYGLPLFTVYGPQHPDVETQFIGLAGLNGPGDSTTPETLLQLIERLALQPHIAAGAVLRIVPIADPVGLELGADAQTARIRGALNQHLTSFRDSGLDGLITITRTDQHRAALEAYGPFGVRHASQVAWEAMARLESEHSAPQSEAEVWCGNAPAEGPWTLSLSIPGTWSDPLAVHWVSQLLVVFLRSHAEINARHGSASL